MASSIARHAESALTFEVSDSVAIDEWEEIARRCTWATFFHTPRWLRAFERALPGLRIATKRFRFADGVTAIFPLMSHSRAMGLHRGYMSTAACCYGGPISADPLSPSHMEEIARAVLHACPNLFWRLNPLQPGQEALAPFVTESDSTEILDLRSIESIEELRMHYRHSVRKQINKGCRAGLRAVEAAEWPDWEAYYALYEKRLEQWGDQATSRYPIALFRELYEARGAGVKLWLAYQEDRLIGGNLNFYHGRHCVEWHAAYDCDFFPCGVRDFLVDWIVRDARERGAFLYDFNPSGNHEGSRRFKQTFGTTTYGSDLIVQRSAVSRLAQACRNYGRQARSSA
ncbi:MAG: GNAT family N-acetyltransferase [Candidatus Eisenbacteria bacterium]|nr:GNAT family N-acetyltransferase [Candidatus Eisenbacteria bacterium]